jgi:ABC-2 type transport system permease protein
VAGEATTGTLRYLLVRPVGRLRLILSKYSAAVLLVGLLVSWVTIVGLVAGGAAYGWGPMPTLSGSTLPVGAALLRIVATAAYITTGMGALAAIGLFASTLSDSAPGASVATVGFAIVSQILESLSALAPIHTFLISERWLAFVDLFRDPVAWGELGEGLIAHALYALVFVSLAALVFARKDVMS